ncbi:OLC1v1028598C1 [Oldenlandia corymbosa var. corymbosa]|uniref:OLC1v1028598C1 n=1 Tax=Oldenlandia corymbosa var. corymbosa TaxID=529605 RepID=A0AAV1CCC3_OLDCO|nr:OLC1v1028598C1 [Oldenlandia corymbosa var. corymbosa]
MANSEEEEQQKGMISAFLGVAEGQTSETARWFLEASAWNVDNALYRFFTDEAFDKVVDAGEIEPDLNSSLNGPNYNYYPEDSVSLAGYGDYAAQLDAGSSATQNDSSLFPPPADLMFSGLFDDAIRAARSQNKWLLVNLQHNENLASLELDRDTWNHKTVVEFVKSSFIFWREVVYPYYDASEGFKVCRFYKQQQESLPAIMVIEPMTGALIRNLTGMVPPEHLLEKLLEYTESSPLEYLINLSRKRNKLPESNNPVVVEDHGTEEETDEDAADDDDEVTELGFPALPEEPNIDDAKLVCRIGFRLPDGRRIQRRFLRSDPVQLLWSFCWSELDDADKNRPFHFAFMRKSLDYTSDSTVDESGLANCLLSLTWD